jgi:hypothetical protein
MATSVPSLEPAERKPFWKPGRIAALAFTALTTAAALIANVQGISGFVTGLFQPSFTGPWLFTQTIKQSSYKPYIGMTMTFQVYLHQDGGKLTGDGEKIQVDGKPIPPRQHQPIIVSGQLSGDDLNLEFQEKAGPDGAARPTMGEFSFKVVRSGVFNRQVGRLEGTFSGTAAAGSGTAVATPKTN